MEKYLISEYGINGSVQKIYKFENGYGASVIKSSISYGGNIGLWEIAVIIFKEDDFELFYGTPITDDVIGYVKENDIDDILKDIQSLPMI